MSTEAKMWDLMQKNRGEVQFNRIECSTLLGVSDLEYVGLYTHGWIEGKVARIRHQIDPIKLQHPLTAQQATWLLDHHRPSIKLRSWLLIGQISPARQGTFARFYLAPPMAAAQFLMNEPPTVFELLKMGAAVCLTIHDLVELIRKGGVR